MSRPSRRSMKQTPLRRNPNATVNRDRKCGNPECGKTFRSPNASQRFCSPACQYVVARRPRPAKRRGVVLTCRHCTGEFYVPPSRAAKNPMYCSRACEVADRPNRESWEKANATKSERMTGTRTGTSNPNYRHGARFGDNNRAGRERFKDTQLRCRVPMCGKSPVDQHHVVYRQHIAREGGDEWHPDDALALCHGHHSSHHRGGQGKLDTRWLRDENLAFAVALLGPAAFDYFHRYYRVGDDPRLKVMLDGVSG